MKAGICTTVGVIGSVLVGASGGTTGGTITLVGSQLRGDVNIYAKAKVIS